MRMIFDGFRQLSFKKFILSAFLLIIILVLVLDRIHYNRRETNELDGCYHVYLVRKLFEINTFPNATISSIFSEYFGPHDVERNRLVCAVGFEPNPHHIRTLQKVQEAHEKCGWKVIFKTNTAAGHKNGVVKMFSEKAHDGKELGATIVEEKKNYEIFEIGTSKQIRLSEYVLNKVLTREIPNQFDNQMKPAVIAKIDIEGSELEVLTDLLITGAMQHVDKFLVEFHHYFQTDRSKQIKVIGDALGEITAFSHNLNLVSKIDVIGFDDETYFKSSFPLPNC